MSILPRGTVTLLFTDIEGSTQLLHELGEKYASVVGQHRRLLRAAFAHHCGVEIDTQGDSFFVAFPRARAALDAALEAQHVLASTPVRVRIGVHTGEPTIADGRFVGLDVVVAARTCAAAHGGQIVVSQPTRDLVDGDLRDLGDHRLKDIPSPIRLYQLGDDEFPPLRTLNWTNLPLPATPLIGRESELATVTQLMLREDVRLVTLTGPGGTGKTRLALEVATELVGDFEDGVLWVPLVGVSDPGVVVSTVASAVGAKRGLAEHVGDRRMLLVLDNFEHVAAAAGDFSGILSLCPRLRVLTTSREPLHVGGEWEFPVPTLTEDEAVRLFRERAAAVRPSLQANGDVAAICARLDRLPLAIELAAARVKVLEPAEMLARLDRRLPLLTGRGRDVPRHQRTLRGTIEWSYELLDSVERQLFRRLAVFAGGATPEAATEVCQATLDILESLVDKSLARHEGRRFQMLATIREYAVDRLEEGGEAGALRQLHAEYFCQFAARAEVKLEGPDQAAWLDAVALEHDNVRAALEWCFSGGDSELGARLASSLYSFWSVRGHFIEARRWLERALATNPEPPPWLETKLLKVAAGNASELGDWGRTRELTDKRLALARKRGDKSEVAKCLNNLGLIASGEGDNRKAASLFRESVLLLRELGDRVDIPLVNLARLAMDDGDTDTADVLASEGLAVAREAGDVEQILHITQQIGLIRILQGRMSDAVELEREVVQLADRLQSKTTFRRCCEDVALLLAQQGKLERAAQLLGKTQALREELGREGIDEVSPQVDALLARTVAQVRGALSEEARLEALRVGRTADLQELLQAALQDAETTAQTDPTAVTRQPEAP